MAYYLVRGRFDPKRLSELHDKLASGAFEFLRPFGKVLSTSLDKARFDPQTGDKKPSASRLVQIEQSVPACDWQTGQCE